MTEINFEVGKTYTTRSGKDVVIYAIHPNQYYAIHGAIYVDDEWDAETWKLDGCYDPISPKSYFDLMPPEPTTNEGWVNVYGNRRGSLYPTREFADAVTRADRIACIRVEWREGQFDD